MGEDIHAGVVGVGAVAGGADVGLLCMGRSRRTRLRPAWDEAGQSSVGKKPPAEVARALQPSWGGWESGLLRS